MSVAAFRVHRGLCLFAMLSVMPLHALAQAPPADPLPSLDELLGLDEAEDTGDTQRDRELERALTAEQAAEALQQAVQLMDDAAARLGDAGETGLTTQRLQEDILRKLDTVIASAQQSQSQSSSSSSSQSQSSGQQSQPQRQQSGGQQAGRASDSNGEAMPPSGTDATLRPQSLLDAAAWGALPDRLRNALEQGVGDEFSSAYRRLTESYYRRLAEQAEEER